MSHDLEHLTAIAEAQHRAYKRATRRLQHRQRLEQVREAEPVAWQQAVRRDDATDPVVLSGNSYQREGCDRMDSLSLADAIRQGCETTTMSRRVYAASNGEGGFSSVCAIGASALVVGALHPLGPTRYVLSFDALYAAFPELMTPDLACPHCGTRATLHEVIVDLNDNHWWTGEKIADWIEQQILDLSLVPVSSSGGASSKRYD